MLCSGIFYYRFGRIFPLKTLVCFVSFISFVWYPVIPLDRGDGWQMTPVSEKPPVFPSAGEERQMHRLSAILQQEERGAKLVSSSGEELEIPDSVYEVLMQIVFEMDQGHGITLIPEHAELSTQRAAELLNVSRPHLVSLLERGDIPFYKVGRHRRVRLNDLLAYRSRRDSNRRRLLKKMTEDAQDAGLYDE